MKFLITKVLLVFCSVALSAELELNPQQAQQMVVEWLEIKKTIADEKKESDAQRLSLMKLLDIYRVELDLLEEGISVAGVTLSDSDAELEAIKMSTEHLRQTRGRLQQKVDDQSLRLLKIMNHYPSPLLQQVAGQKNALTDPATKLRAKVLAMVAVIKSTIKFNQVVTYSAEILAIDGVERQLQVLYLGLGRGFYVSGDTAGLVEVDSTGWKWIRKDQYWKNISAAIGVYQKTTRPELVKLPIHLAQ